MRERIFHVSMLLQRFVVSLEKIGHHQVEGWPVPPELIASSAIAAMEYRELTGNDAYEAVVNEWDMERQLEEESTPESVASPGHQARRLPWGLLGFSFFS